MQKILYFLLAGPFIILAKIADFICWEILDTNWKKRKFYAAVRPVNQEQAVYISRLVCELGDEKRRADELHQYYQRQLKIRDEEIRRRDRLN